MESLSEHMKTAHEDGSWTCEDCHFQTNQIEYLRQHLKTKGHQPSEASRRQTNEVRECYTCKKKFEGYIALMYHRSVEQPSNKVCNKIPNCTGFVKEKKCWYKHPELISSPANKNIDEPTKISKDLETECRSCGMKFSSRNKFMEHYTTKHTSNIVCREWLKNNCRRTKCWYRHSHIQDSKASSPAQSVPNSEDFISALPPPQPPSLLQPNPTHNQTEIQKIIFQMALRMNTLELGISESRNQMHTLQEILSKTKI